MFQVWTKHTGITDKQLPALPKVQGGKVMMVVEPPPVRSPPHQKASSVPGRSVASSVLPTTDKPSVCQEAGYGRGFSKKKRLTEHLVVGHQGGGFYCSVCNKKMMSSRTQHFREYTEHGICKPIKYFECSMDLGNGQLCTYKCWSETQINSDKRRHGVATPNVKCTRCDKDFSNQVT